MIRTGYSFKTAFGKIEDVAARLEEIGWETSPMCDRLSTFGFVRWREVAKTRPVFGVELPVSPAKGEKNPALDWWTFMAVDELRPLHELVRLATGNPGAALSYREAIDAAKYLVAIAGPHVDVDQLPKGSLVSLCPGIPRGQLRRAIDAKMRLVARPNNVFATRDQRELYRVALGKQASAQTYPQWIVSDVEFREEMAWAGERTVAAAIVQRDALLSLCRAELRQAKVLVPKKPKTLRKMCEEGAARVGIDLGVEVYRDRLDRELALIADKKFEDYFHIIADMIQWAKERMVVGPARGSSCGSLVCYLLDITAIDPIEHDLLFERFIDVTRADLPDIDLDFSDQRRDMVFKYVEEKYGREHVARLGSVAMFKARSILARIGVGLKIPQWEIDEMANTVVKRSFGDSRRDSTILDAFADTEVGKKMMANHPEIKLAADMEGHPNSAGQHAAGVVITEDPVTDIVAIDARTGTEVAMCDKRDAEKLNLLKIDMLGLTQLGVFERCLELIGEPGLSRFLEKIPMDDEAAFEVLNDFKFSGIFQFVPGSASATLVVNLIKVHGARIVSFQDIVDLTALVRPGPLGSGQTEHWLARRGGKEKIVYFHPLIEPDVRETLGMIVYQEQVMNIGRNVGGLSWDDVTALRKAMSKSLGKEYFDKYGDRWKKGAEERGWADEQSRNKMWDDLCQFGMWAFNKSHSVAYAMVSYWCLWLKAHHPLEFAAATLDAEGDVLAQIALLRELKAEGVEHVAIDPENSTDRWQVHDGRLIGPLTAIKGIGPKKVQIILDHRRQKVLPKSRRKPLPPGLVKLLLECKTEIDSLTPIGDAIERHVPGYFDKVKIVPIREVIPGAFAKWEKIVIVGVIKKIAPLNENEPGRVIKRKSGAYKSGPLEALNFFVRDDFGADVFCKIDRFEFNKIGRPMLELAKAGSSLYAVKGTVPPDFRMIRVTAVRYIGEMDGRNLAHGKDEQEGRRQRELEGRGQPRPAEGVDGRGEVGVGDRGGDGLLAELGDRGVA